MKLRRLNIGRLPGIDTPFLLDSLGDGFHVVFGPNGIGKSSVCRAVEALFWSDRGPSRQIQVTGEFELDGEEWWAERDGDRVRWQRKGADSKPPDLPASHLHRYFFLRLRDLIDAAPDGMQDVATEIRRQMSGGFNLPQVISQHFPKLAARSGSKAHEDFNACVTVLRVEEGKQFELQNQADGLAEIENRLRQAENDERRLKYVENAIGLARRRSQLEEASREIAALPRSLEKLSGKELEQVRSGTGRLETLRADRATLERELEEVEREAKDSGLSAPIDPGQLRRWKAWGADLQGLETDLKRVKNEHAASSARLGDALDAVGGGDLRKVELNLQDHGRLFGFLRRAQDLKTKGATLEEQIRLLSKLEFSPEERQHLKQSVDAAAALRTWLRAPDPGATRMGGRSPWIWLAGAALLALLGAGLAFAIHPGLALLAGIGGTLFVVLLSLRGGRSASSQRGMARTDFQKSGLDEPDMWEAPSVDACLRDLDRQVADLMARQMRARDRDGERVKLQNTLEGLDEEKAEIDCERQALKDSLKLAEVKPDAELVDLARALDQLRQRRNEEQGVAGEVDDLQARYEEMLSTLADALASHEEAHPVDASSALAAIDQLGARDAQWRAAQTEERRLHGEMERNDKDIGERDQAIAQIFINAEIERDDLPGLALLVEMLPDYIEHCTLRTRLQSQNDVLREALEKADEAALAESEEEELEQLQESLSSSAQTKPDLLRQIAEINAAVKAAKSGHEVADLIEKREAALAHLEEHVAQALFKTAGRVLVHKVEQQHEQIQMPRVLRRVRELFSTFTHHAYEIEVGPGGEVAHLTARDLRTREGLGLEELSDGTRIQLLLAARIAFAEEVERGALLPLFLDEALDQSDPARYHTMVKCLGRMAQDQGRQIFYFTSDPSDLDRIQAALREEQCPAAQPIDLGLIRRQAASVPGPAALRVEPSAQVPAPEDRSAEEYGAAIGVPPLDPRRGHPDQHLFHLLWDDLNLLHGLLQDGIQWVGQWHKISGSNYAAKLISQSDSATELDRRADLFEVFCQLWIQGRGQPVDRDAIEESGALAEKWLEGVAAISAENQGDGKRLIEIMRGKDDERTKGLRVKSIEGLEQFLRDHAYMDDRPVLDAEELHTLVLTSPAAAQLGDGVAGECIRRWWELSARAKAPEKEVV